MLEEAFKKKSSFSAIEFQTQILYSAADQVFYTVFDAESVKMN
jgi:hypothetical protein